MSRFGKRLYLHTVRTITGPLMLPGLITAWLAKNRLDNAAVARRLSLKVATPAPAAAANQNPAAPALRLAVVGDTHTENDGASDLHAAVHALNPDGILHLGDYCDEGGLFETLRHLANWDSLHQNRHTGMLHVLGNHDKRTFGRFWFQRLFGPAESVLQLNGWRVILLDNTEKHGVFSAENVAQLTALAATPQPAILCFHKPPQCERWPHHAAPERVTELFQAARAAGVKLALCGHCHVYDETEIEGVRVVLTGGGSLPGSDLGFGAPGRHILELTLPADTTAPPAVRKIPLSPNPSPTPSPF